MKTTVNIYKIDSEDKSVYRSFENSYVMPNSSLNAFDVWETDPSDKYAKHQCVAYFPLSHFYMIME